jgi:hypothetical protein
LRVSNWRRLAGLLAGAVALAGCTINPPLELAQIVKGEPGLTLAAVPFYPQTQYQCGPAALAGVLGAAGVDRSPEQLSAQVYLPARQGSLQLELLAATRRAGRIPYLLDTTADALVEELESGRPVLVLQNLGTPHFPSWHYAVLVGLDVATNRVYLNSGRQPSLAMAAPEFMRSWDWAGRWAMVVLRVGEIPGSANATRYLDALLAFEAVAGVEAALPAWSAAHQRWPVQGLPYLALGNRAYADDERSAAVSWYYQGLLHNPGNVALANNLASVLGQLGCPRLAQAQLAPVQATEPADSSWQPALATTLGELAAHTSADPQSCYDLMTIAP